MYKTEIRRFFVLVITLMLLALILPGCKGKFVNLGEQQSQSGGTQQAGGTQQPATGIPKVEIPKETPGAATGQTPGATTGQTPGATTGQTPGATTGQSPGATTGQPSTGNASPAQKPAAKSGIKLNVKPAPKVELKLKAYNGGFFKMNLPTGWVLETVGEYENFGFHAYDPQNPARKMFFYGNMRYFLKSEDAKNAWATYLAYGGYRESQVYADALVLSPATTGQFFQLFNDYTLYAAKYGIVHNFPLFENMEILESTPRNSPIASNCVDDSIVRAVFDFGGVPCEGLLAAGVADAMTAYMYNVDAGYYVVYFITGVTAPADEFPQLLATLSKSLGSFEYSQQYIQQGVQRIEDGTKLAIEIGQMLSASMDRNNQAWHDRQRPGDALSQKRSDATMGYDRLYDSETGQTYRAELGFYDEYNVNRDKYSNPNLQLVKDNDYDRYGQAVTGYIYK